MRQGCCVSPLLFILTIELLAIKLRDNVNIESITSNRQNLGKNTKLISYADDMTLCLKDKNSLSTALKIIEEFSTI